MSASARFVALPDGALLSSYARPGCYVDCLVADLPQRITLAQLITAFYTGPVFRMERWLIGALLGRKAGNPEVMQLVQGRTERFSAWTVEARADDQILLCDFRGATRSWLMVMPQGEGARLHFGSAVLQTEGILFRLLLGFHKLYARALLAGALRQLRR